MNIRVLAFVPFVFVSFSAFASDPFTSVYSQTTGSTAAFKSAYEVIDKTTGKVKSESKAKHWVFFEFADTDNLLGGLSVSHVGSTQAVKFNAINYYLWLGGKHYLPFQLYLSDEASGVSNQSGDQEANRVKLLDPESGTAIKFPILWTYQSDGDEFCAFQQKDENGNSISEIGHCAVGGDLTIHLKNLKTTAGNAQTALGETLRVGGSVLFPVLSAADKSKQGYLAIGAKLVYSHTNISDSTQLFTPVIDVNGQPVKFKNSIFSSEVELKWAFVSKLAIAVKWLTPLQHNEYLKSQFRLSMDTQF